MFKNYISIAWRNLRNTMLSSSISILCLAVGISGAIIMTLYLNHELAYDTHQDDHERIFRMEGIYNMAGTTYHMAITPFPLALAMEHEFSEVESYARFFNPDEDVKVLVNDNEFLEEGIVFADSTVFDVFSHHFLHGSPRGALSEPNTMVLTRSLSEKFFEEANPVGMDLNVGDSHYMITGVIEDLPENTHFRYHALMSMASQDREMVYTIDPELFWNININYTYIKVREPGDMRRIADRMHGLTDKYAAPMGDIMGASAEFVSTPLRDTHFNPIMLGPEGGSKTILLVFSMVALFLVVIAAINYTNLATAKAAMRAREIGIRKTAGASRGQLIVQFLSESLLIAVIALFVSLLIVELLLPAFNALTNNSFVLADLIHPGILIQILLITILTGVAAGIYPALFLSRMQPAITVKGHGDQTGHSGKMRKILVVFQFTISIILVGGTLSVQDQLAFLRNKPLGFEPNNTAVVNLQGSTSRGQIETLEQRIRQHPKVTATSKAFSVPGKGHNMNAVRVDSDEGPRETAIAVNWVDHQFTNNLGIEMLEGRSFEHDMRTDVHQAAIINETATRKFGWQDDPIGKRVYMHYDEEGNPQTTLRVIGVFSDYHFLSLDNQIDPMMMIMPDNPAQFRYVVINYAADGKEEVHTFLEEEVRAFDQALMPEVAGLKAGFLEAFENEERQSRLFGFFAVVTIVISFIGLFGLSSYMINQRRKEIGIRKVLGSSLYDIMTMLYKEFMLLILIAVVVAGPITWWLMSRWLDQFIYAMDMSFAPIITAAATAIIVALLTVSFHSLRAARIDPISTLRAE